MNAARLSPLPAIAIVAAGLVFAHACSTPKPEGYRYVKTEEIANAAYDKRYVSSDPSETAYDGPYWSPDRFANQGAWPEGYELGQETGANACLTTGDTYVCDTTGDGLADVYGNRADGSYAEASHYVNASGEAYDWDRWCKCWKRTSAKDGPYIPQVLTGSD
ncbi:hypothetical protein [Henriciella litoralis]|uniref:hypothetical protein n=1 Tax=Henriciella litoralis TaxID=568102 RepID=UPI000A00011D|nr:hypothetical protein [Henriciella litoralis]